MTEPVSVSVSSTYHYVPPQGPEPEPEPIPFATSCEPSSYTVGQAIPTGVNELHKGRAHTGPVKDVKEPDDF